MGFFILKKKGEVVKRGVPFTFIVQILYNTLEFYNNLPQIAIGKERRQILGLI